MKDPSDDIRDWIYTVLNGNVTYGGSNVPVYSFPPENVSYPYIVIGEQSGDGEDGAKDCWIWDVTTEIWVYTQHSGHDATYVPVNTIASSVMQLLRTADTPSTYGTTEDTVTLANFNLIRVNIGAFYTSRVQEETGILISKQVNINIQVEEE